MKITTELPVEPGRYWMKLTEKSKWEMVLVKDGGKSWGLYLDNRQSTPLDLLKGDIKWGGKILDPEELQQFVSKTIDDVVDIVKDQENQNELCETDVEWIDRDDTLQDIARYKNDLTS